MLDEQEKARLTWHCRRGMLELDLILQRFIKQYLDFLSHDEIDAFDKLLGYTDPELFAWLMGYDEPHDDELKQIVFAIRASHPA